MSLGGDFSFGVILLIVSAGWKQLGSSTALMETTSMVWWRNGSKDTGSPGDRSSLDWTGHKKVWWQTTSGDMQNHHQVSGLITAV